MTKSSKKSVKRRCPHCGKPRAERTIREHLRKFGPHRNAGRQPDKIAHAFERRQQDLPYRQINYGQLQDIFYVKLRDHGDSKIPKTFLLARVILCEITKGEDASRKPVEYKKLESLPRIIELLTVEGAVGRAKIASTWGISDRSKGAVRTLFTNDDNVPVAD